MEELLQQLTNGLAVGGIYALVALLIWLDDPGPVIYMQTRIGKHGKPFPFPSPFFSFIHLADSSRSIRAC